MLLRRATILTFLCCLPGVSAELFEMQSGTVLPGMPPKPPVMSVLGMMMGGKMAYDPEVYPTGPVASVRSDSRNEYRYPGSREYEAVTLIEPDGHPGAESYRCTLDSVGRVVTLDNTEIDWKTKKPQTTHTTFKYDDHSRTEFRFQPGHESRIRERSAW